MKILEDFNLWKLELSKSQILGFLLWTLLCTYIGALTVSRSYWAVNVACGEVNAKVIAEAVTVKGHSTYVVRYVCEGEQK